MKIRDGLYRYPGHGGLMAMAHLRVYDHDGSVVAIIGELTDNPSTSITNCAETVCDLLRTEYGPATHGKAGGDDHPVPRPGPPLTFPAEPCDARPGTNQGRRTAPWTSCSVTCHWGGWGTLIW